MRTTPFITACLILLAFCIGCVQESDKVQESHESEALLMKRKYVQLRKAKEETERENIILKDNVASLTNRGQKLNKKMAEQKFEMDQLRRQVETLADLPAERDRYKKQVEKLKADVIRLELELRKCREKPSSDKTSPEKSGKKS